MSHHLFGLMRERRRRLRRLPGWTRHWSDEWGIPFYWHEETDASVWEEPVEEEVWVEGYCLDCHRWIRIN